MGKKILTWKQVGEILQGSHAVITSPGAIWLEAKIDTDLCTLEMRAPHRGWSSELNLSNMTHPYVETSETGMSIYLQKSKNATKFSDWLFGDAAEVTLTVLTHAPNTYYNPRSRKPKINRELN